MIDSGKENSRSAAKYKLLILLHIGFFLIGIITVLLGQILPVLSQRLSLNDQQAGYLFIAQFAGSLAATFFYDFLIKKFGYLRVIVGGFCLSAFGCAGLNFDSWVLSLAAICIYGVGIGLTIPAINLLVIELNPKKSSSALNIINFCWGTGAILCKPFVDYVGSSNTILLPTVLLGISFLVIGAVIAFSNYQVNSEKNKGSFAFDTPIWTTVTAWLIAIFNFVHIGIESSVAGWITTYESRLPQTLTGDLISAALVYFLFLVLGRALAPLFFRFLQDNAVLFCSLLVMTTGIILILWTENFLFLISGAAVLGFGTASVFPTNMSRFIKIFGAQATHKATPIFVFGGLGGAFMTWFVGFTSNAYNNLRAGLSVILIGCLLLIILQTILVYGKTK